MKRTSILLSAMLCAGITQATTPYMSIAQPTAPNFDQTLAKSRQDFGEKGYAATEKDARSLLTLARSPQETSQALRLLGESLYRLGSYDEARKQWTQLLDLTGTADDESVHTVAHLGLAKSYYAQGRYDFAIPHYQPVVEYFDKMAEEQTEVKFLADMVSLALGDAYYNSHQDDLAKEQFNRVIASDQATPALLMVAYNRSGQINYEQDNYEQARVAYQQVLVQGDAGNLKAPSLRTFATNQIVAVNTSEETATKAKMVGDFTSTSERSLEFDQKVSKALLQIIDKGFTDVTLTDEPFVGADGE